jgi:hypothetical protein
MSAFSSPATEETASLIKRVGARVGDRLAWVAAKDVAPILSHVARLHVENEELRASKELSDEIHRERYMALREALGATYPTAEETVGAAIAAIHDRNALRAQLTAIQAAASAVSDTERGEPK